MGQRNCLINTASNFLASPAYLKENHLLIYVTYSKKDAILLKEKIIKNLEACEKEIIESSKDKELEDFDVKELEKRKNKIQDKKENEKVNFNKKFCIFTLNEKNTDSEYYYLPKIALDYAQNVKNSSEQIFGNKNKLNILFCFDDVSIFALKEKKLHDTSRLYQVNSKYDYKLFMLIELKQFLF